MVIIGGSGSTGSSLLQSILNRHPDILAGQETSIFMYPQLYHNWRRYKRFIIARGVFGVKSRGWTYRNGMDLFHADYGWKHSDIHRMIPRASSFNEFTNVFFDAALKHQNARFWVEKTPQNAYAFLSFLKMFPKGKVIQMLRNPYDTMASLMARGFTAYQAAGYYVYNTASAASVEESDQSLKIHYADLVDNSEDTVRRVMNFIGWSFDKSMLTPSEDDLANPLKLDGWNHSERDYVRRGSVGRFVRLSEEQQNEIIAALNTFQVSSQHQKKNKIKFSNFKEICHRFHYEYLETDPAPFMASFHRARRKDVVTRTWRLHPGHLFNYPGAIKN